MVYYKKEISPFIRVTRVALMLCHFSFWRNKNLDTRDDEFVCDLRERNTSDSWKWNNTNWDSYNRHSSKGRLTKIFLIFNLVKPVLLRYYTYVWNKNKVLSTTSVIFNSIRFTKPNSLSSKNTSDIGRYLHS